MEKFRELGISEPIVQALEDLGFQNPTPVQAQIIPQVLSAGGGDWVVLSQTGSGKTAAFGIPLVEMTTPNAKFPEALVLCPTRELCNQVANDIKDYSKHIPGMKVVPVFGGAGIREQITQLRNGASVVVATPGRLIDLMEQGKIRLDNIKFLVLDEADEMLSMGFQESIDRILEDIPSREATLLFSATMPPEIRKITKKYMNDPGQISIAQQKTGGSIKHVYTFVRDDVKFEALRRFLDKEKDMYAIIFCRTRRGTAELSEKLLGVGYTVESIHGDLSQSQRDLVMSRFRSRLVKIMVATDVAARGIDVDDLTHVIHFDLPDDREVYTHRSGRTARAGKSGISLSLIARKDKRSFQMISRNAPFEWTEEAVPSAEEVMKYRVQAFADQLLKLEVPATEADRFAEALAGQLVDLSREELIRRIMFHQFPDSSVQSANGREKLSWDPGKEKGGREGRERDRGGRDRDGNFERLFLNIGELDGVRKEDLIRELNRRSKGTDIKLGKIQINNSFSFIEVDADLVNEFSRAMVGVKFGKRRLEIEAAKGRDRDRGGDRGSRDRGRRRPY